MRQVSKLFHVHGFNQVVQKFRLKMQTLGKGQPQGEQSEEFQMEFSECAAGMRETHYDLVMIGNPKDFACSGRSGSIHRSTPTSGVADTPCCRQDLCARP